MCSISSSLRKKGLTFKKGKKTLVIDSLLKVKKSTELTEAQKLAQSVTETLILGDPVFAPTAPKKEEGGNSTHGLGLTEVSANCAQEVSGRDGQA